MISMIHPLQGQDTRTFTKKTVHNSWPTDFFWKFLRNNKYIFWLLVLMTFILKHKYWDNEITRIPACHRHSRLGWNTEKFELRRGEGETWTRRIKWGLRIFPLRSAQKLSFCLALGLEINNNKQQAKRIFIFVKKRKRAFRKMNIWQELESCKTFESFKC